MKRLLIICATVLFGYAGLAQNTGFLGKRFLLKTNVVNGFQIGFMNLDVEATVARKVSVTAGFRYFDYVPSFGGREMKTQHVRSNGIYDVYQKIGGGKTTGWLVNGGIKYYLSGYNRIIPAPLGFYTEVSFGYGNATMSNFSIFNRVKYPYGHNSWNTLVYAKPNSYNLEGSASIIFFEVPSFGYQFAILKFLTFDVKMSFEGYYSDLPSNLADPSDVGNMYVSPNLVGFGAGNLAIGFALYGKLGFSLF